MTFMVNLFIYLFLFYLQIIFWSTLRMTQSLFSPSSRWAGSKVDLSNADFKLVNSLRRKVEHAEEEILLGCNYVNLKIIMTL